MKLSIQWVKIAKKESLKHKQSIDSIFQGTEEQKQQVEEKKQNFFDQLEKAKALKVVKCEDTT